MPVGRKGHPFFKWNIPTIRGKGPFFFQAKVDGSVMLKPLKMKVGLKRSFLLKGIDPVTQAVGPVTNCILTMVDKSNNVYTFVNTKETTI